MSAESISREGGLRMDQRNNESPDLWAIRAFVKAIPYMDDSSMRAATHYISEFAFAELAKRKGSKP